MQSFSRGGLIFRFAEYGAPDGLPVVLFHGFPGSSATWAGVVAPLTEQGCACSSPISAGIRRRPVRLVGASTG
jgi:pimeloyl-ACP methyl ester carboxylesterase